MGPRLLSRGRAGRADGEGLDGHRFNGAAASQPRKVRPTHPRWSTSSCFNGAAASQPRKELSEKACRRADKLLQWGRGFSAAEGPRLALRPVPMKRRFNGAAASQPRKVRASLAMIWLPH